MFCTRNHKKDTCELAKYKGTCPGSLDQGMPNYQIISVGTYINSFCSLYNEYYKS